MARDAIVRKGSCVAEEERREERRLREGAKEKGMH